MIETTIAEMKEGLYDFTEDSKCSNCGNCCSNFLPVSKKEVKKIQRYIKKHKVREQVRRYPTAKGTIDFMCPFRSENEKKCLIYPARPAICQDFQCDKPKKGIMANKAMYHGKIGVADMRATFFGGKPVLEEFFTPVQK